LASRSRRRLDKASTIDVNNNVIATNTGEFEKTFDNSTKPIIEARAQSRNLNLLSKPLKQNKVNNSGTKTPMNNV
jgi:hypothetical protein